VSEVEHALLATDAPRARVEVVSNLHRIAGKGRLRRTPRPRLRRRLPPSANVDAVRWFIDDVLPRVRDRLPTIRFHCIGSHATDEILALADAPA
jgi:hypothetical protein